MKTLPGVLLTAAAIGAALLCNLLPLGTPVVVYAGTLVVSSLLFLWLVRQVLSTDIPSRVVLILVAGSVLLRLSFLSMAPVGSDDAYRYVWDGKVQAFGFNPYRYAPDDPRMEALHSRALPAKVNFPSMKTVYFPLPEWIFLAGYELSGEDIWGYKLELLVAEMLTMLGLFLLLRHAGKPVAFVLLYALCPLSIVSFAIDCHVDGFGFPFLVFALVLYLRGARIPALILLSLSISIKPVALVLLPILFFNEKRMWSRSMVLMIPGIVLVGQFLPYIDGVNPFESLLVYANNWTFNGGVFNALLLLTHDNQLTRLICGVLLLCSVVLTLMSNYDLLTKAFLAIFLLLVFSPVVHPWYVAWLAVVLPVVPRWSGVAFVATISLASITVLTFASTGVWKEYPAVLALEYLPVAIFFFRELPLRQTSSGD